VNLAKKRAAVRRIGRLNLSDYTKWAIKAKLLSPHEAEDAENEYRQFLLLYFIARGLSKHGVLSPSRRAFEIWKFHFRRRVHYEDFFSGLFGTTFFPDPNLLLKEEVFDQGLVMSGHIQKLHCKNIHGFTNYYETV
jgi:hypothetical protein